MRIGELAEATGLPTQTIRFYERRRLVPPPARTANGYRRYDDGTVDRLRFIRNAQAAGLTLAEIGSIVELRDAGTAPCDHVASLLDTKLEDVRTRLHELATLERELVDLRARSRALDPADCTDSAVCHLIVDRA